MSKNLSATYYQENKERRKKEKKSDSMVLNAKKDLSEDEKQKLVEYRKRYHRMRRNALL